MGNEHHRQPAGADRPALLVLDVDVPDVQSPPFVVEAGRAGDPAGAHAAQVIGIHLDAHGALAFGRCNEVAAHGPQGLGEHHAGSTVEEAVGLAAPRRRRRGFALLRLCHLRLCHLRHCVRVGSGSAAARIVASA